MEHVAKHNRVVGENVDIEAELLEAREKMQEVYEQNRERMAVVLQSQREQQALYDELRGKSDAFEQEASEALKRGDREEALTFVKQKQELTPTLIEMGKALSQANSAVESVTKLVNEQREGIEKAATLAIQYKTQLAAGEIQKRIYAALQNLDFGTEFESFKAGKEIVHGLEFENAARLEVQGGRLDFQIASLEEEMANMDADAALAAIESKLRSGEIEAMNLESVLDAEPAATDDEAFLQSLDETINALGRDHPLDKTS